MVTAWCAKDKQATLTKFKSGQAMPLAKCDNNPVKQQYQLGQELGVEGTPALVLSDGRLLPGYVPAQDLAKMLGLQ
jgi:thiol:disulfide interchange protein DsbC